MDKMIFIFLILIPDCYSIKPSFVKSNCNHIDQSTKHGADNNKTIPWPGTGGESNLKAIKPYLSRISMTLGMAFFESIKMSHCLAEDS